MGRENEPLSLDDEVRALRRKGRRTQRIWLAAIVGNLVVFGLLIAVPYVRAHRRLGHARTQAARLAVCLCGGEVRAQGLALPDPAHEGYAERFWSEPSWPRRCAVELDDLVPEPTFWLLPDIREAEVDARRAVELVREELQGAADADRAKPVPDRPWRAMQRLLAALTLWSESVSDEPVLGALIAFPTPVGPLRPERVPMQASESAALTIRPYADGAEALALDGRGVSWVRVHGGRVDGRRLRRPQLLREGWLAREGPILLFAMRDERCGEGCARRASGVVKLDDETVVTPEPTYLQAHPLGAGPASVRLTGDRVHVLAAGPTPSHRVFELVQAAQGGALEDRAEEDRAPLRPASTALLPGEGAVFFGEDIAHLENGRPVIAARAGPPGMGELRTLVYEGGAVLVATGPERSAYLREGDSAFQALPMRDSDELALAASARIVVAAARQNDALRVVRCEDTCEVAQVPHAGAFDVAAGGAEAFVAYELEGQIHVLRWGDERRDETPAPCFSDGGLFCGAPTLGARAGRVLLAARRDFDMFVVEYAADHGWRPLVGLR